MTDHRVPIVSGARRLRQLLSDPSKTVVAPGVYDGLTARLALAEGFECLYMVSRDNCPFWSETNHAARPAQGHRCRASVWLILA